ncbi:antibiotic biosynthesis monooxygenase family protein [Vallicoccus soli]|uniref:Antibiotic biosynthesis monooxygenase n=1 Tax=Vallicoccus soli TaxID=2339232 RepID=A0A3A3Z195_9ACTN|nr:antibiotic biosynthesis monooxygenase family protein [Vallicoccus soli]RJK97025.1 antibiotic biosynthesis monooxygenase [Vallicoccus soli]
MLVVTRYAVAPEGAAAFLAEAREVLDVLAAQAGCEGGEVGRATDDPGLWTLATRWAGVGAYRRALSAYDVRVRAVPLLSRALDEPTAYEVLDRRPEPAAGTTARAADAGTVGVGRASAPHVPTDLDGAGGTPSAGR